MPHHAHASLPDAPTVLRRALQAMTVLGGLMVIAGALLFIHQAQNEQVSRARSQAEATARLVEEHVVRTFHSTDFILDNVVRLAKSEPMDQLASSRNAWEQLVELTRGLPEPGTLWIADAEGDMQLSSLSFPWPHTHIRDRYYFQAHKQARLPLAIGPLVATKTRSIQAFHVSKRVDDANGNLIGVAAAGIDAPFFTDFHQSLNLSPESNVAIFDLEGRVILRQPDAEKWVGASVANGPVMKALATAPTGTIRAASPLDGIERIVAYRLIKPLNIVVSCGISITDLNAEFHRTILKVAAAAAALIVMLGALAKLAFVSLAREEATLKSLEQRVLERTEEARLRAEEAQLANESKTKFLATASHDLRQPLQAAGMFTEVLAIKLDDSPHRPIVEKLRMCVDSTQTLLSSLLDVSTLEAGKLEPSQTAFPLAPLLASLANQGEQEALERGLRLKAMMTDAWVISDPVLLERLLRNLLINAIRYTEKGGVLIGIRHRGDHVVVQVIDTGIGIAADKQATIFEDFTRLGEKGSGFNRGLGLGLAVVRRMALLLDLDIELNSRPGHGSCFGVRIPLAPGRN